MGNLTQTQLGHRGQMLQDWLSTLLRKGYPKDYAIAHIEKKLSDKEFLQHFNALAASTGEHTMDITKLKERIREMVIKEMEAMEECSSTGGSGIGGSPGAEIKTPNAFKRKKVMRKNFVNEQKYRQALFEDIVNNVTFGMKLSDQAKELMDFIRGSQAHADELKQINDLLKGMGQAGEADKSKAFQLYQEFIQNSARDFVNSGASANVSGMTPEEYFLQKDLLQLTYYFTQKFETPMTGGADAIDKEPGEQPQDAPPPEGGDGGDSGGGGGGGGGSSASAGLPDAMDGEGDAGAEGGEGEAGAEAGGEAGAEGGEGDTGEENPEGGPPKPENVKEAGKIRPQGTPQPQTKLSTNQVDEMEAARQAVIKLAKQYIQSGQRGIATQLVAIAKDFDSINESKKRK